MTWWGRRLPSRRPVAQTTRNRLRGILTTPEAQIIFVDTPGIHKPITNWAMSLVKNAQIAIHSVDVLLFMVDCSAELGGAIATLLTCSKTFKLL